MNLDNIIDFHSSSPKAPEIDGVCPGCKRQMKLVLTPSLTRYEWSGRGENPNASFYACQECSDEYIQIMQDLWSEYWGNVL